jgi:hypothetical protein
MFPNIAVIGGLYAPNPNLKFPKFFCLRGGAGRLAFLKSLTGVAKGVSFQKEFWRRNYAKGKTWEKP